MGSSWLLTGLLFMVATILLLLKKEDWSIVALIGVTLSQFLILSAWSNAKYNTITNIIILITTIINFTSHNFKNNYKKNITSTIQKTRTQTEILTEKDLDQSTYYSPEFF